MSAFDVSERYFEAQEQAAGLAGANGAAADPAIEDPSSRPAPGPEALAAAFVGLSHDDVLRLELPPERYFVEDLVPMGGVGTIAGVPETHKSWVAQAVAVRVARGEGAILGCAVAAQAAVGYFWQDDSTREEAERVKLFERVHANPPGLPLRWFLNEGLRLPRDLRRLRATIGRLQLGLVVIDSFYNALGGEGLKDEAAEQTVAQIKTEIADATGATVLLVDHMPWATDTNRQRLRAYGGVFKNAATRFGIYIDAVGTNLSVEARGNNIRGFRKTPAYWDAEALELRLVPAEQTLKAPAAEIAAFVLERGQASPGEIKSKFDIEDGTLRSRRPALLELGIGYVGQGKQSRYVALDPAPAPRSDDCGNGYGDADPHGYAESASLPADPAAGPVREAETGDLQGEDATPQPALPTGASAALRDAPEEDIPF